MVRAVLVAAGHAAAGYRGCAVTDTVPDSATVVPLDLAPVAGALDYFVAMDSPLPSSSPFLFYRF